jgi:predicted nucleic acid-binding protein
LRHPTGPARISALNLAEVIDVMVRTYRRSRAETADALNLLESGGLLIAGVDADIGTSAGELHAWHYDRKTSPLSMADCVAVATAAALGEPLATSNPPLAAAAHAEGVTVIGLQDANGRRPQRKLGG